MGLFGGATETVKIVYKIDTDQAKAAVRSLSGEQKKAAKELLDQINAQNAKTESHIALLGKMALGAGAVVGAYKLASGAAAAYFEREQLERAARGADMERLRLASGYLIDDTKLLKFAAAALNTTYALSSEQMGTALTAMRALTSQGKDQTAVLGAIEQAITEGSIEPLKKYGIVLDEVSGKQEKANQLVSAMADIAKNHGKALTTASDDMRRMNTTMHNAWGDLERGFGAFTANISSGISRLYDQLLNGPEQRAAAAKFYASLDEYNAQVKARSDAALQADLSANGQRLGDNGERIDATGMTQSEFEASYNASHPPKPKGRTGGGGGGGAAHNWLAEYKASHHGERFGFDSDFGKAVDSPAIKDLNFGGVGLSSSLPSGLLGDDPYGDQIRAAMAAREAAQAQVAGQPSLMETLFGKPDDLKMLSAGIEIFSQAMTGAFDSWVSGSASASEAMRKMFGDIMSGTSRAMFANGISESAQALISLAKWDPHGAALHGGAAAASFAGAAIVGGIARELGGKGAPAGKGAGASIGGGSGGGGRGSDGNTSTSIFLGDDWALKSPRERAMEAESIFAAGRRNGNSSTIVRHN